MWTSALGSVATTEGEAILNLLVQVLKIAGPAAIMGLLTTVLRSIEEHARDVVAFAEKLAGAEPTLDMLTRSPEYQGTVKKLLIIVWKVLSLPFVSLGSSVGGDTGECCQEYRDDMSCESATHKVDLTRSP